MVEGRAVSYHKANLNDITSYKCLFVYLFDTLSNVSSYKCLFVSWWNLFLYAKSVRPGLWVIIGATFFKDLVASQKCTHQHQK